MRRAILFMTLALTLVAAELGASPPKSPPADVGPGRIAWFDVTTSDLPRSKEFYGKLFGWEFAPVLGTDLAVEIVVRGTPIGTLRVAEGKISTFNGVVYVQVANIQASCKTATDLGGTVPPGFPFNLPDATGAVAVVIDPAGHPVGMYSRTPLPPVSAHTMTIPGSGGLATGAPTPRITPRASSAPSNDRMKLTGEPPSME